jgi:tetratricopeptide (TPR) repeat protein
LGEGKPINQAIESNTAPLSTIEKDFAAFAKQRAEQLAPGLDWAEPKAQDLADGEDAWISRHPKSFWSMTQQAKKLLAEKKWAEAKVPAQKLAELYPDNTGANSGYMLLAEAHRGLNEIDEERSALNKLARIDADATEAYLRLMELDAKRTDWAGVNRNAQRFLAVNPLVSQPYRYLAQVGEETAQPQDAIKAYQTLLLLDPPDPADVHFRLAKLLYQTHDPAAKRQVLEALEEAPRFRDAHRLLLQIAGKQKEKAEEESLAPPIPPAQPDVKPEADAK